MKLITRKDMAASALKRAKKYAREFYKEGKMGFRSTLGEKICLLEDLGPNPSLEDVDRIMENDSWTRVKCRECGDNVELAIRFAGRTICPGCLLNAVDLVNRGEHLDKLQGAHIFKQMDIAEQDPVEAAEALGASSNFS